MWRIYVCELVWGYGLCSCLHKCLSDPIRLNSIQLSHDSWTFKSLALDHSL